MFVSFLIKQMIKINLNKKLKLNNAGRVIFEEGYRAENYFRNFICQMPEWLLL
jgi:hypothetical protein